MGNCSSCLGSRRKSVYEEDEDSRLLFDDADTQQYGSFNEASLHGQGDAQEVQREFDALQQVVAHTSDNMVDVFEITQPTSSLRGIPNPYAIGLPDDRLMRYQSLLSKLSPSDDADLDAHLEDVPDMESTKGHQQLIPETAEIAEPFVGDFTDVAKAA